MLRANGGLCATTLGMAVVRDRVGLKSAINLARESPNLPLIFHIADCYFEPLTPDGERGLYSANPVSCQATDPWKRLC